MATKKQNNKPSKTKARQHLKQLRQQIERHDVQYYVEDNPEISDAKYDKLKRELVDLEKRFPELVTANSPTQRVGGQPKEEFGTVHHKSPMLSLESIGEEEEFRQFYENCCERLGKQKLSIVAEPKYDGLSVELAYWHGELASAATRGDGEKGEDVTANVRTIRGLALQLPKRKGVSTPHRLVVRGEVYMEKKAFAKFNRQQEKRGEKTFANPRNAAAGSLRQLDPKITARRPLKILFWEVVEHSGSDLETHWQCLQELKKLGLPVDKHVALLKSPDKAKEFYQKLNKERDSLPYEIDGCVFKINDVGDQRELGTRASNPRWAVAWKFAARREVTRIKKIQAQVGRTGALTPVATLEPVQIGGVEVSHVTPHNQHEIDRKGIRIGDHVLVERAGDVIPNVVKVMKSKRSSKTRKYHLPKKCPVCGGKIVFPSGEAIARCTNASCPAQLEERLTHFASKEALDIQGLGRKVAEQLVKADLAKDLADLFDLKPKDISDLDHLAGKSAQKLVNHIQQAKERVPLSRVIYGLSLPHVGQAAASDLAREFGSLNSLLNAKKNDLAALSDMGEKTAADVRAWCTDRHNRTLVRRLKRCGLNPLAQHRGSRLKGKTLVVTGTLKSMSRAEAKEASRQQSGKAAGSVSGLTDYLVVGKTPGATKTHEAETRHVKQINEIEFHKLLGAV